MKRFTLCFAVILLPILAACNFSVIPPTDFTESRTFDLASPATFEKLPFTLDVDAFSSECAGRYKMVFREASNRIDVDEYNRWSMPPGAMLTKYLSARFAAKSGDRLRDGKPVFELDGTVLNCELDRTNKTVELMVHYFIIEHGNDAFRITGTENYSILVKDTSAEAFADGLSKAASEFADHIVLLLANELKMRDGEVMDAPAKK